MTNNNPHDQARRNAKDAATSVERSWDDLARRGLVPATSVHERVPGAAPNEISIQMHSVRRALTLTRALLDGHPDTAWSSTRIEHVQRRVTQALNGLRNAWELLIQEGVLLPPEADSDAGGRVEAPVLREELDGARSNLAQLNELLDDSMPEQARST